MPLHTGKGQSIQSALGRTVDYVENPDKTDGGELISSYACNPTIAEQEFIFIKAQYTNLTGRTQGDKNVIAYHLRQSFKPDEIDPQKANKIGYNLAMSLTKGKHAFIVCTHVDRKHIHSHIVFNSTTLDCTKKFRNFWNSAFVIRKISDILCLENSLSVIENPKESKGHYGKWLGNQKPLTHSDRLRQTIDKVLAQKPIDFPSFLLEMQSQGYEVKTGTHLAFKSKEQKKFIRLKSLGNGYSENEIKSVIDGKSVHNPQTPKQEKSVNVLVDIQAKMQQGRGAGYEQWAKTYNVKQMAKTINYLTENNLLNYDDLKKKSDVVSEEFHKISKQLKATETRLKEVSDLRKHIIQFAKTKETYEEYKKTGYSSKFKEDNITEILLHQAAKNYFKEIGLKKLPKMAELKSEQDALSLAKKKAYSNYHILKKEMQELSIAKQNIEQILEMNTPKKSKQKSSLQR